MIEKNHRVTIAYTLKDQMGNVLDQAPHNNPLSYVHGYGRLLPGLENNLEGRQEGEHFFVHLGADEGYGPYDENLLMWVDKEELAHLGDLTVGAEIEMFSKVVEFDPDSSDLHFEDIEDEDELDEDDEDDEDEDENVSPFIVKEIHEDRVLLDGNHPLAGIPINLEVSILNVEMASFEEIEELMLEDLEDQDPLEDYNEPR